VSNFLFAGFGSWTFFLSTIPNITS